MKPEAQRYLFDIWRAVELLTDFTAGKAFADYEHDAMLRSAVECQFEIVGEATARLAKIDPKLVGRTRQRQGIVPKRLRQSDWLSFLLQTAAEDYRRAWARIDPT